MEEWRGAWRYVGKERITIGRQNELQKVKKTGGALSSGWTEQGRREEAPSIHRIR